MGATRQPNKGLRTRCCPNTSRGVTRHKAKKPVASSLFMILVLAKISKGNFGNGGLPDGGKNCAVLSRLAALVSPTKTHTLHAGENAAYFGAIHPKCDLSYFGNYIRVYTNVNNLK